MSEQIIQQAVNAGIQRVLAGEAKVKPVTRELLLDPVLAGLITFDGLRQQIGRRVAKIKAKRPVSDTERMFTGLEIECATEGIELDTVNTVWYKSKRYSIKSNPKQGDVLPNMDFIEELVQKHIKPVFVESKTSTKAQSDWFDRLVYTDTHIGMDTNKDGIAMYATEWNRDEQLRRAQVMVDEMLANQSSNILYIDELGDFMDGWDGLTTRGGHLLPQNMSNEQAFDTGMDFKMLIIDNLVNHYDHIYIHNICNDNHAGSFGYVVNSAVKRIVDVKYKDKVTIENQKQFINHYFVGKHAFVNTHGKDSKSLKFGFKPKLDPIQSLKIDGYLKHFKVYRDAEYIEFAKGDSHQLLLDYSTNTDFNYFSYPAFAPSSEWVQVNFSKGLSGFVIQNVMYNERVKNVIPKFF